MNISKKTEINLNLDQNEFLWIAKAVKHFQLTHHEVRDCNASNQLHPIDSIDNDLSNFTRDNHII